jgi:hypothetical protein
VVKTKKKKKETTYLDKKKHTISILKKETSISKKKHCNKQTTTSIQFQNDLVCCNFFELIDIKPQQNHEQQHLRLDLDHQQII